MMKFYVRTISPLFLLVVLSLCGSQQAFGLCGKRSRKAPAEQRDTTKSSAYDKFFKEEHRIARGLFTLHEMKGRVYFEIPLRLMDRSMLLGTTISATSDNGHGIVGSKPKDPLHFAFTRAGDRIAMRLISERTVSPPLPDHAEIGRALATSKIGAIYRLFKIETFTPDSSAVVVDATNLFVSDDERLSPFDKYSQHTLSGRLKRKESFEKEKSYVTGIKSFSDNVSVSSSLNYRVTISERGLRDVPVTIAATRSILLLDSLPVSPRIPDSRIAVFPTGKMLYSPTTQGARPIWYANRWRLEPSDIEAYRRGELVDPVKPIVFYIDRNFPRTWLPYVIEGVNQWSELFEQIGITCDEMKDKDTRKLIFVNEEYKLRFFLAKSPDVPTYVEYGAADIGVVGKDTILEENRNVYEVLDLGFGKCRMCVCGPASAGELLKHHERIRVASKYPNIAREYFYNKKHQTVDIIKLNGSVELGPLVELSDVIVDIVETGSTLKENGLEVLEEVCPLSARMIVNPVSMQMEADRIRKLVGAIREQLKIQS